MDLLFSPAHSSSLASVIRNISHKNFYHCTSEVLVACVGHQQTRVEKILLKSEVTYLLLSWFQLCIQLEWMNEWMTMHNALPLLMFDSWWNLTSNSWAPCSFISGTKSVIGRGKRGGKFFLESVTSVGHSSSGGKPMTLKSHIIFSERARIWIICR